MIYDDKFFDDFKHRKIVVKCKTEDAANRFLQMCEQHNINWFNSPATAKNYWYTAKEHTIYICDLDNENLLHGDSYENDSYFDCCDGDRLPLVVFESEKCNLCSVYNTCDKRKCIKNVYNEI